MAWNEPGGKDKDPWGGGNRGNNNDGPPDLDELAKKFQEKLNGLFGSGGGQGGSNNSAGISSILIPVILIAGLYIAFQGVYRIDQQERGVVLRLGEYHRTLQPGLNWATPLLESVTKVNVTRLRQHSASAEMLTKDENIVSVSLSVQFNIADAKDYALRVRDPEQSLKEATDSALRHVVGSSKMDEVLTVGREKIAQDVQLRLQEYLDNYQTGIMVTTVNVEETKPPREVEDAFDDVIKAREDQQRVMNEAQAYANGVIPDARGKSQRLLEEANGYEAEVLSRAQGEAKRFSDLLVEYKKAPIVTRERLYIDAMQEVMGKSSKVMVDVKGGNNMMYLPLDKMVSQSSSAQSRTTVSPEVINQIEARILERFRQANANNSNRGAR